VERPDLPLHASHLARLDPAELNVVGVVVGYNVNGILIDTWGMPGTLTWAAAAKYTVPSAGGKRYTLASREPLVKARGKARSGLDWATLMADFKAMGAACPWEPTDRTAAGRCGGRHRTRARATHDWAPGRGASSGPPRPP
jgi:hypothetical protein